MDHMLELMSCLTVRDGPILTRLSRLVPLSTKRPLNYTYVHPRKKTYIPGITVFAPSVTCKIDDANPEMGSKPFYLFCGCQTSCPTVWFRLTVREVTK